MSVRVHLHTSEKIGQVNPPTRKIIGLLGKELEGKSVLTFDVKRGKARVSLFQSVFCIDRHEMPGGIEIRPTRAKQ